MRKRAKYDKGGNNHSFRPQKRNLFTADTCFFAQNHI